MIRPSVRLAHPYPKGKNRRTRPPSEGFLSCSDRQSLTYPVDQVPGLECERPRRRHHPPPSPATPMPTEPIEDRDSMGPGWLALGADPQREGHHDQLTPHPLIPGRMEPQV